MTDKYDDDLEDQELDRGDDHIDEDEEDLEDESLDQEEDEEVVEEEEEDLEDEDVSTKIPKYRLDEVIRQRDYERQQAAEYKALVEKLITKQDTVTREPEYDYDAAEEAYATALLESDSKQAAAIRREIDNHRMKDMVNLIKSVKEESSSEAKGLAESAVEERAFRALIVSLESQHPFLNTNSKKFNPEAVDTINALAAGYANSGKDRSEALTLAVKKVSAMYGLEPTATTTRNKVAGKKAAVASKSQPPKSRNSGVTIDSTNLPVSKMKDSDLFKLSAKELAKLRGDF